MVARGASVESTSSDITLTSHPRGVEPATEVPFMSRVLVATASTEFDQRAIEEALGLLGSDHEYLFLTVEHGVTAALAGGGDPSDPVLVPEEVFADAEQGAREEGRRSVQEI